MTAIQTKAPTAESAAIPPRDPIALVLQGGGALGAYELGVARRLYGRPEPFKPAIISGVSIGAITAVLLARPKGGDPLRALEAFWNKVTITGSWMAPVPAQYASVFGNPHFFMPRQDVFAMPSWTSFYDTAPLRQTLEELVDCQSLGLEKPPGLPRLIMSATDIGSGEIAYFDSDAQGLTLDHVLASGSLPPSFPMTTIKDATGTPHSYWDGGLFDNTPLGPVVDALKTAGAGGDEGTIIVVNLFPNAAAVPRNMTEVGTRMLNLMFANRTKQDVKQLRRFNEVAELVGRLRDEKFKGFPEIAEVIGKLDYVRIPNIIEITRPKEATDTDGIDFSPAGIAARADEGQADADRALGAFGL